LNFGCQLDSLLLTHNIRDLTYTQSHTESIIVLRY
jgi:hypothetical protein